MHANATIVSAENDAFGDALLRQPPFQNTHKHLSCNLQIAII